MGYQQTANQDRPAPGSAKHEPRPRFFSPGLANGVPFFTLASGQGMIQKNGGGGATPAPARPHGASLPDTTVRVRPSERAMYDSLRNYFQNLPAQFQALLQAPTPRAPWIVAGNSNVQEVLALLSSIINDLNAESLTIRFDHSGGTSGASYDSLNGIMHLQPFSGREERNLISIDFFHEYTHVSQDRTEEAGLGQQRAPWANTRETELGNEIGARRTQSYFAGLIRAVGYPLPSTQHVFDISVSNLVFLNLFEAERTATGTAGSQDPTQSIRNRIETAYSAQLARNASFRNYSVTIEPNNHAMLHHDVTGQSSPADLGEIPAQIASLVALRSHLSGIIRGLSFFSNLYLDPNGSTFTSITFFVTYQNSKILEFGL